MKKIIRRTAAGIAAGIMAAAAVMSGTSYAEVTPNPVISRGCPAYSGANPATAASANDEHYFSFWFGTAPDYLAYDLSGVPEDQRKQVIAVWYNTSSYDRIGNYISRNMEPSDYTVEVNAAPGGEYPADGWKVVSTVEGNTLSSRQHLVNMEGYNWIRLNISKADDDTGKQASVNFDIHNVSEGVSDSWLFLGDSITAGGMNNCYGTGFATFVNRIDPAYFPVQENGGIGGITSKDGRNNIDRWLEDSPCRYVSIAYGTNDAWGNQTGAENYYDNTKYMIDAIIAKGKVPVLPKIPYSTETGVNTYLDEYNAMVDKLWEEYGDKLVKGPDFDAYFREHTSNLSDGVHPDSEGYEAMRQIWAETMYANVYKAQSGPTEPSTGDDPEVTLWGDANCDGETNMADAVLVMQSMANPDDYGVGKPDGITEQGKVNADVYIPGTGITNADAVTIQEYKLGLRDSLPVYADDEK